MSAGPGPPEPPDAHRLVGPLAGLAATIVLFAVVALLVLPGHRQAAGPTGGSTSTSVAGGPTCPGQAVTPTSDLLPRLFTAAPNGFTQVPDAKAGAGPLTAAQLAAGTGRSAAVEAELRLDGFEGAALRVWIDVLDTEQAQVTLVEFACPAGASEYFNTEVADGLGVAGGEPFQVAGIAGAQGERATEPDRQGHYLQVVGVTSGDLYEQAATFTAGPDDGSLAGAICQLQLGSISSV